MSSTHLISTASPSYLIVENQPGKHSHGPMIVFYVVAVLIIIVNIIFLNIIGLIFNIIILIIIGHYVKRYEKEGKTTWAYFLALSPILIGIAISILFWVVLKYANVI